jgi:chemosensory pili system protein ChpA (sensor histidine kinase/response regulator)
MTRNPEEAPIGAFATEFAATLPAIDAALAAVEETPDQLAPAREAYRLCHAIKGAASMVGLAALGYLLNQAEELLDPDTAILTPTVVRDLRGTVPLFSAYLETGLSGEQGAPAAMTLAAALRRCGAAADDRVLAELLEADARELAAWRFDPAPSAQPAAPAFDPLLDLSAFSDGLFDLPEPTAPVPAPALPSEPPSSAVPVVSPPPMVVAFASTPAPAPPAASADLPVDADTIDPELAEIFAEEAQEHLEAIARLTKQLSPVSTDRQGLQDLRRAVHTLKGAAGVVGYMTVSRLAHRMEDRLDALYDQEESPTPEIIHLLTASSDALHDLLTGSPAPSAARAETVRQLFARFDAMAPPAPATPIDPARAAGDWPASAPIAVDVAAPPAASEPSEEFIPALIPEPIPEAGPQPAFKERRRKTDRRVDERRDGDQMLRVPVARVDELVRFMTELVINRSTFEQHYAALAGQVEELKLSNARLRRVAQKLETDYEARALGGNLLVRAGDHRSATNAASAEGFDELEFDRYTEFHLLTRELAETASDIATVGTRVGDALGDFDSDLTRLGRITRDIQDKVMEFRMVPLGTLASRLERAVRVAAEACGKSVEFALEGEHVSMDKSLLQEMADPLMHLLRNAVDHGIESPADRQARGKSGTGRVTVRAYHEGTEVVLEVTDDGRGLDLARIRRTAVDRGYVQEAEAAGLDEESLAAFLFEPGFSTASRITEISGRGVGMDIVKGKVVQLNGRIRVLTQPGAGATWIVRLPMTLAITRILLFRAGGEIMGLPLGAIVQIVRPQPEAIVPLGSDRVISLSGQTYPVRDLADWLGIPRAAKVGNAPRPLVVATLGGRHVALEIDEILSSRDAVIKTLGTHLRRVQGVWGATLLGDGTVVLILNPADLGGVADAPRPRVAARAALPEKEPYQILIVDDSLSMRHVLSAAVRRAGWTAIQARDGLEALEAVHRSTRPPDLILLDIEMPRMDGFEFLATIRGQKGFAALPIVMLTSRGGEKHRDKAQALGATDYLVKPFQEDTLIERVGRLVQSRRQAERRVAS